ncbi:MAG: beta-galactosidase [Bryobacteraceae bacterium]|nr:beta-galactosidase [Bryobacteraceae bacterium]
MRLITGIDTAMPDVGRRWNYHARWNQHEQFWQDDFRQLASFGFDVLRWQLPWSMVEPARGEYRWDLIDPKVELATKLGMDIFYPIAHFNYPAWIAGRGVRHAVYSSDLPSHLADYTERLLARYKFRLVIPVVEVQMDAFQRGWLGNWQPHQKSRTSYRLIKANLVRAFRVSSAIARSHGATVFCSEPASEVQTVLDLGNAVDVAGIDLYPHMHRKLSVVDYLRLWWASTGKPLCISEFGTPETYNPSTKVDDYARFIRAGVDEHRVAECRLLRAALEQATAEGIPIPYGGWYPGTGNIGWGLSLTRERKTYDCDRAGLVDLTRTSDGTLTRVACDNLVCEVMALREVGQKPEAVPAWIPAVTAASPCPLFASGD